MCGKLCERAKHTVAKSSLRSKLAALQKDVGDTSRKLGECSTCVYVHFLSSVFQLNWFLVISISIGFKSIIDYIYCYGF